MKSQKEIGTSGSGVPGLLCIRLVGPKYIALRDIFGLGPTIYIPLQDFRELVALVKSGRCIESVGKFHIQYGPQPCPALLWSDMFPHRILEIDSKEIRVLEATALRGDFDPLLPPDPRLEPIIGRQLVGTGA